MNGYHVHAPVRWIESALMGAAALGIVLFCLLGWLIFPLLLFTPWHTLGVIGLAGWITWLAACLAYELRMWLRWSRRAGRTL